MITPYIEAVYHAFESVLNFIVELSLPLAIIAGLAVVAAVLARVLPRDGAWSGDGAWRRRAASVPGYAAAALLAVAGWAVLRAALPLARQDILWRESAEATANPTPDAPPVSQFGPALAALTERTYTRTLTLPPDFLQRIGAEGVGVLSPYLTDPSAENVLRLVDTFRRSWRDVVFTREVTRLDEEPLPFAASQVRARFRRLPGRAYDVEFEGRYTFRNAGTDPADVRFLFPLPEGSTLRDLNVSVGGQAVTEPNETGAYEWKSRMEPGESREAVVRYRVVGARTWQYDLGSRRRRVQQFRLEAVTGRNVRFLRGSLQPTARDNGTLRWEMDNVVTAQQVAMAFPPDTIGRDSYLQALSALPVGLALFLAGVLVAGAWLRRTPAPGPLAGGVALFTLGLGASLVLANYLGPVAGVLLGPLAGAGLAAWALGRWSLIAALPAALLPATFLSPNHSGLLALLLVLLTIAGLVAARRWQGAPESTPS